MKKLLLACLLAVAAFSCKKTETQLPVPSSYVDVVSRVLKDSLSSRDYSILDVSHSMQTHVDSANIHLLRIPINDKDVSRNFLVVKTDAHGRILKGSFISISRNQNDQLLETNVRSSMSFNGSISYRPLTGSMISSKAIVNGHIQKQSLTHSTNTVTVNKAAAYDAELPEVIVYTSYNSGGISWGQWYNLLAMLEVGSGANNAGNYFTPSGGGGGGGAAPAVQVDFEAPENKEAVEMKKLLDCFGNIPDAGATFTVTIASDIPVDNDPSKFFNWSESSPGHVYIELYKLGANGGLVSQNFGFYPNSQWKVVGGGNIASKISNDANHEYNAKYTISVNASQFQAALSAAQSYSSHSYNVSAFNCTDFALSVFNAAGGNMTIPKYHIPGYPNGNTGSSTPQGVYNKISDLAIAGNTNASTNTTKKYGGTSKGPCN